jgi:hypothetical protein
VYIIVTGFVTHKISITLNFLIAILNFFLVLKYTNKGILV